MTMTRHCSQLHIVVADNQDVPVAGCCVSGELPSYLMEQSRSARVLVQRQRVDLAQESFPTRHHHSSAIDVDRDWLSRNFAEEIGGRYWPRRLPWSSFSMAGLALFELAAHWGIPVPNAHLEYPNLAFSSSTRSRHLRPKRCAASVVPMTSNSWAPRTSGAKYFAAMFTRSRAALRSPLIAFVSNCRNWISAFVIRFRLPLSITTISSLSIDSRIIPGSSGCGTFFGCPLGFPDFPF